jgi:hypothetical protein
MSSNYLTADNGVISGTAGIIPQGGSDGTLQLRTTTSAGTPTTAVTIDNNQNLTSANPINTPNTFGFKNRLINGAMKIAQRGTSGTSGSSVPTTSTVYPCVDRFYVYATGATVTASQTSTSGVYSLSIAGASSVTGVGIGQRIEASNCVDLAGTSATLSLNISNSLLTTVTWTASYAGSTDTWSSKTQIATGTFTVTSTSTNYSVNFAVPSAATTGIEILLTVGAQTSGTWVVNNIQLEKGTIATSFDYRPIGTELALCQRYLPCWSSDSTSTDYIFGTGQCYSSTQALIALPYMVTPRVIPTGLTNKGTGAGYIYNPNGAQISVSTIVFYMGGTSCFQAVATVASGLTIGAATQFYGSGNSGSPIVFYATGCEL